MTPRSASGFVIFWLLSGCVVQPGAQTMWEFDGLPGATVFPARLQDRLATAWADRGADYVPRTRHLRDDGTPRYINRLFLEASPYLRQHAHNPLNWRPWGDEAFALARALGRPILLSIGYSTCHWCHVMEGPWCALTQSQLHPGCTVASAATRSRASGAAPAR